MENAKGLKSRFKNVINFLKEVMSDFSDDKVMKYSASLAYYTVFSIAPILIIIITIAGWVWGREAVTGQIVQQIQGLVGKDAAVQIQAMIANTHRSGNSFVASIVGGIILIFGATGIFAEIQDSINSIWGLKSKPKKGLVKMVITWLISFSFIISLGFVAMVALLLNAVVDLISTKLGQIVSGAGIYFVQVINYVLSFVIISFMFSVIFKVLLDARIKWRDVVRGAMVTAVLFILGRYLIGIYIGSSNVASVYGTAGSIVVILVWVYYTAVILYFGVEFTKVYAIKYGSKITPNDYAVWIKVKEEEQPHQTLDQVNKDEHPRLKDEQPWPKDEHSQPT